MFAFVDPQFGVALKALFRRLHLGATSMYWPSLDEFLQRWHRSRTVYSPLYTKRAKGKFKKKSRTTKSKGVDFDKHTDTNNSDASNQASENEVENVKGN